MKKIKEISKDLNTYASEIIRQLISELIADYSVNEKLNLSFMSKKKLTEGLSKEENKDVKVAFNKDDYYQLRRIAEENNTYASEIIRQLMADFVEKYEQEHKEEAKLFPAHAGVILSKLNPSRILSTVPRTRGGDPGYRAVEGWFRELIIKPFRRTP